jgi:predicted dehydrogenase
VDVVAICARDPQATRAVATRLGVPSWSTDWRAALRQERPEIVTIATPASLRGELVEDAIGLGCHLFCEKPLAATAEEAGEIYRLAANAGIKHAFGLTHAVDPSVRWLSELVAEGAIGTLLEIEASFRFQFFPTAEIAWSWFDCLSAGGGILNNGLTHWLGMLETVCRGETVRVTGEARRGRPFAPDLPELHDFRERLARVPSPEDAARREWRTCDADAAFSSLAIVDRGATSPARKVVARIAANGAMATNGWVNAWRLLGSEGTLHAEGAFAPLQVFRQRNSRLDREPLPVPSRLTDGYPKTENGHVDLWTALLRDFVAHINEQSHRPYPTFRDGWRIQTAIDAIRSGAGWRDLSAMGCCHAS